MNWQDLAFGIGQIVLNITLIPILRSKTHKPPLITSIGHGAVMVVFTIAYASLGFWFAPLMAAIEAILWFWIATHHGKVGNGPSSESR